MTVFAQELPEFVTPLAFIAAVISRILHILTATSDLVSSMMDFSPERLLYASSIL